MFFLANYEENESRGWYCALLSATGIQYALAITGIVLLYITYDCGLAKFFISFNMILCIIVSIISIMPQVQERISRSGLLQSSVVTLYVIYLTWSALSNNPNPQCHENFFPSDGKNKVCTIFGFVQLKMLCQNNGNENFFFQFLDYIR